MSVFFWFLGFFSVVVFFGGGAGGGGGVVQGLEYITSTQRPAYIFSLNFPKGHFSRDLFTTLFYPLPPIEAYSQIPKKPFINGH